MKFLFLLLLLFIGQSLTAQKVTIINRARLADSALFLACHASTLVSFPDGNIRVAWFGGKFEGSPDVGIWTAMRKGKKWTRPLKIATGITADGKPQACWNPVLFLAHNGRLYLHYKIGPNPREWKAWYKWSADEGNTWSAALQLPETYIGPAKNKPLQLANGDILYPSSTESADQQHWQIHLERSDAQLQHWEKISIDCDTFQTIQPSLLTYPGHRMQLLARSKQNVIVQSWSADDGATWSKVTATSLPNPNSGSDAVTLNGLQILVYNPLPAGKNWWEGRSVLKLAVSHDGINWKNIYTFEEQPQGEFSYPAIIADKKGNLLLSYTDNRKGIKFVEFRVE